MHNVYVPLQVVTNVTSYFAHTHVCSPLTKFHLKWR